MNDKPNAVVSILGVISKLIAFDDAISYMVITVCESAWATVYDCYCEYRVRPEIALYQSGLITDISTAIRYCLAAREHHVAHAEFDKLEKSSMKQKRALFADMDKLHETIKGLNIGATTMRYRPLMERAFDIPYYCIDPNTALGELESTGSLSMKRVR